MAALPNRRHADIFASPYGAKRVERLFAAFRSTLSAWLANSGCSGMRPAVSNPRFGRQYISIACISLKLWLEMYKKWLRTSPFDKNENSSLKESSKYSVATEVMNYVNTSQFANHPFIPDQSPPLSRKHDHRHRRYKCVAVENQKPILTYFVNFNVTRIRSLVSSRNFLFGQEVMRLPSVFVTSKQQFWLRVLQEKKENGRLYMDKE